MAPRASSGRRGSSAVHRITSARQALTADIHSRQVKYVISMGVRTACFILAFFTTGWWRGIFFAGAIVLPYVAVVFANAGREPGGPAPEAIPPPLRPELGRGPDA